MPGRLAPQLYIITDRNATVNGQLSAVVAAALGAVARFRGPAPSPPIAVQLREKDLPTRPLLMLAEALRAVTKVAGVGLYINDRLDVALSCGADGVHLGDGSLPVADVRRIAPHLGIGVSVHAPDDISAAATAGASFAVFGPVFDTPSKRAFGAPQGQARLAEAARQGRTVGLPVLAIGGVTPENAPACLAAGADGLAVIRAVIAATDPLAVTAKFLACFGPPARHFDT